MQIKYPTWVPVTQLVLSALLALLWFGSGNAIHLIVAAFAGSVGVLCLVRPVAHLSQSRLTRYDLFGLRARHFDLHQGNHHLSDQKLYVNDKRVLSLQGLNTNVAQVRGYLSR